MPPGELDAKPFRDLLHQRMLEGWLLSDIAYDAGYVRSPRKVKRGKEVVNPEPFGDSSRLRRAVGMKANSTVKNGKTYRSVQEVVTYDTAVRIVRACGYDPVDFDL